MADAVFHAQHGDPSTHIERINPGDNPAHAPGIRLGPQDDGRKAYRLLAPERHGDGWATIAAGTVVMLHPGEVGPNHVPLDPVVIEAVEEIHHIVNKSGRKPRHAE